MPVHMSAAEVEKADAAQKLGKDLAEMLRLLQAARAEEDQLGRTQRAPRAVAHPAGKR